MKKIMFSIVIVCSCAILGAGIGTCVAHTKCDKLDLHREYTYQFMLYEGIDEILESADIIITGEVESIIEHNEYDEYIVKISDVKKGEITGSISIRNYLSYYTYTYQGEECYGKTNRNYVVGDEYVFILQHIKNVYEEKFVILGDAYIPVEKPDESTILSRGLEVDSIDYIDEYHFKSENGRGKDLSTPYIESENLVDVFKNSSYIAKVEAVELCRSTENIDVYLCNVIKEYKGNINKTEESQIIISFFKNTVEIGKEYDVCLNSDSEDALIYTLSSKNSLLTISSEELERNLMLK